MFPPEPDAKTEGRVRRFGRRGRPLSLVVAVLLLAAFWVLSAGMAGLGVVHDRRGRGSAVAGIAFWTVVFALVMWRVWRGGPAATTFVARIATMLGTVFLFGTAAFTVLLAAAPGLVVYLLPALLSGVALLTAGVLLRREVSRWRSSRSEV
jgi:tellurite resistance protein TehA-like permease